MAAGQSLKTIGDYIDDPHVTCLDTFSLNPVPVSHAPGPLEAFCQIPSDNPHREDPDTVTLAPGVDVINFYDSTDKTEVWRDFESFECLVPQALQGWEFFTLLRPKPEGTEPMALNPDSSGPRIDLLFGRPPGAQQCPSMLFIIVPAGQQYQPPAGAGGKPGRQMLSVRSNKAAANTPYSYEKACGNLDAKGQSLRPRLLALCPVHIYDESSVLPDGASWGLFVGPRHRRLLMLNKTCGRIDVHLMMLFSMDAVFQRCQAMIEGTARLYEPFGTAEQATALFADIDPMKVSCGFTNAVVADHVDASLDGRDDYRRLLGIWPPSFFVSNSSDNLRYLTPLEVQQHRTGKAREDNIELPVPHKLEDFPVWVMGPGVVEADHRTALRKYRTRVIPRNNMQEQQATWRDGVLQLLGLHTAGPKKEDSWGSIVASLGGCAEVTFAGAQPWQEPGASKVSDRIDARPTLVSKEDARELEEEERRAAVEKQKQDQIKNAGIHWRHSLDLVPGADFGEAPAPAPPLPAIAEDVDTSSPPAQAAPDAPSAAPPTIPRMPSPPPSTIPRMPDSVAATLQPPR